MDHFSKRKSKKYIKNGKIRNGVNNSGEDNDKNQRMHSCLGDQNLLFSVLFGIANGSAAVVGRILNVMDTEVAIINGQCQIYLTVVIGPGHR